MNTICLLGLMLLSQTTTPGAWEDLLKGPLETKFQFRDGADPKDWTLKGGVLDCQPGKGWIGTKKNYGDFEIELEWKLPKGGNSGVFLRVPEGDSKESPSKRGAEIQILDDEDPMHKGKLKDWQYSGSIYTAAAAKQGLVRHGEWNTFLIRAQGTTIAVTVNGMPAAIVDVDHSTLKGRPIWGALGLQNHGSGCTFRNVRIRELQTTQWFEGLSGNYKVLKARRSTRVIDDERLSKMSVKIEPGKLILIDGDHQESGRMEKEPNDPPSVWRIIFSHGTMTKRIPIRIVERHGGIELGWSKDEKMPPPGDLPEGPGWARLWIGEKK